MYKIISEIIYNPKVDLNKEVTFKTSPALKKTMQEIAIDNEISIDMLINNALLHYFVNEVENDQNN